MNKGSKEGLNADNLYTFFILATHAAFRWHSLNLFYFLLPGEYEDLQFAQPLQCFESFKLAPRCNLSHFLVPLMIAITAPPRLNILIVMLYSALGNLPSPTSSIPSGLKFLVPNKIGNPLDILPHLRDLEALPCPSSFPPNLST
jgi:hypothetical protein